MKAKAYESALSGFVEAELMSAAAAVGFFCCPCAAAGGFAAAEQQQGVIRANCLDCLDRTNVFQWYLNPKP